MAETTTVTSADANTGARLIGFLDAAALEKDRFNVAKSKVLRTATLNIFEIQSCWENTDLRSLHVNSLFERFRDLKRNPYSDDSVFVGGGGYRHNL